MKYLIVVCLSFLTSSMEAQSILREYIALGLENNLALKQKESGYQQSLEALKEARGLFYPSVSINARYTVSEGGRVIDFPVGDLMNPVYSTLNQLTSSNMFPVIENEEIRFLRPTEHETKIRLIQPVFNTDLYYNAKIKEELSVAEEISVDQYKRELVAEISKAYYTVGMTVGLFRMLEETRLLLVENVRVNTRLFENDKITRDILLRSQTELSKFDQQLQVALKNKQVASAYFNFLLNRPLSDSILVETPVVAVMPEGMPEDYSQQAVLNREEIKSLEKYGRISDLNISMHRSSGLPDLFILADYGFQGEEYQFNKDQDYLQASIVLSWDIFSGLQNRSKIRQALIQREMVEDRLHEAKSRIELQVINSLHVLKASELATQAAESQAKGAREVFRLVHRKYEEGQASLIEFMDARNSLTQAEENLILSRYSYLSDYADFEKAITHPINQ
ncbi:MAG: TolC family protein [Bacteroidales bacterium]|nr:TolC family protein [Bacteroidales bacterium]